jgi:amino acid adenylation domain-containing protein/non-ribosomal peptide synthase protein (TIGR01720 family)/FkbM family methyltransferase
MSVGELIAHLREIDVRLWVEEGRLRFNAPRGVVTPALRDEITGRRAEIINFLESRRAKSSLSIARVEARGVELPLSFAQQRLWFIDQMAPGHSVYNIPAAVRLKGRLNVAALGQSLQEIARRHEVLRTTFPAAEGKPTQVIRPEFALTLRLADLRGVREATRESQARRLIDGEVRRPFDLAGDPLLRVALLRLDQDEYVMLLTMHHIVSDGWSLGVLIRELMALYGFFSAGSPSTLPELATQYADFALWQHRWLTGEVLEGQLSYWKRQLADAPPVLYLPTDRAGAATQSFSGAHKTLTLSAPLSERLKTLSQAENVTLFMTLLAVFQVLLSRYTGQTDIPVGVPIANRNRAETEPLIGFFTNTVVMRTDLSGDPTFRELLRRVRDVALGAYEHQDVPFERLVEELRVERSLSHTPLFQVMFALQNAAQVSLELPELKLDLLEIETGTTKFDLTLEVNETGGSIVGSIGYKTDLFDDATIERMMGNLRTLLEGAVAEPDSKLSELPLLTEEEQRLLLEEWNPTAEEYASGACLHDLFREQAARTPDAVAAQHGDEQLSYGELDRRSEKIAHHLLRLGVGVEAVVALYLPRSLRQVEAVVGVLKAGGAYLPLDTTSPAERVRMMVEDANARVVLSESGDEEALAVLRESGVRVIGLAGEWESIESELDSKDDDASSSVVSAGSSVSEQNLAYVIYTSGSTGRPKGVMITHLNVRRLLTATESWYHFDENDVWTMFHSYAFDFSVWEFWGALLYGGKLLVVPYMICRSPEEFYDFLVENQVSILNQTPSAFRQLMEPDQSASEGKRLALRYIIFGGEPLEMPSLEEWFARHDERRPQLVNMYGITETTVHVTYRPVLKIDPREAKGSMIGGPIPDLQVHLLDKRSRLVPLLVTGEIHVGGVGLARGYLNRPELTAERFIPDPFGGLPGCRLYKSGDLASRLDDGDVAYIGRIDHQVKVRGFRIELGEIKAALEQHAAVQEAVVLVREDTPGDKRLVAYLVPDQARAPAVRQLLRLEREGLAQEHLRYQLPNGTLVFHLNEGETEMVYEEVFEEHGYLRHGISLEEGSVVFDVGANIGLFSLFVGQRCANHTIYAFEPIPQVFELLRLNTSLHGLSVKLFDCGLASESGSEVFAFYPHCSIVSGRAANVEEEREVIKSFLFNKQRLTEGAEFLEDVLTERLAAEMVVCKLKTISEVIRENQVERIDLLKIDVEKSEWEVLSGINDEDWGKIKQLVVEVHDIENRLRHVTTLLEQKGFDYTVEQSSSLRETGLYNVYAVSRAKEGAGGARASDAAATETASEPAWSNPEALIGDVRHSLKGKLPDYMIPTSFMLLESVPLTPNGKTDLRALPAPAQSRPSAGKNHSAPRNPTEQSLAEIWAGVLGVEGVGIHDNFFELGGDSILSIQVIARAKKVGLQLTPKHLFQYQTIAELAEVAVTTAPAVHVEQELVTGDVPLTPIQSWFFEHVSTDPHHFNQAMMLQVEPDADPSLLEQAVRQLLLQHDALRLRFVRGGDSSEWTQSYAAPEETVPFTRFDLSGLPEASQRTAIETAAADLQASLNLSEGPLVRAAFFETGAGRPGRLLLIIHHLVVDGVSWRILLEDLQTAYGQLSRSEAVELMPKTTSYQHWSRRLREYEREGGAHDEEDYWLAESRRGVAPLPLDRAGGENIAASARRVTVSLDSEETQALLQEVPKYYRAQVQEILLAALAQTLSRWTGSETVLIDMEGHGREELFADVDVSRTVGWFTSIYPLALTLPGVESSDEILGRVKEQFRAVPRKGIGYGLLRYLGNATATTKALRTLPPAEVSFNYLGQFDQALEGASLFRWADESSGPPHSLKGARTHLLDVGGFVTGGSLQVVWSYSEKLHEHSTVERLAANFMRHLRSLIARRRAPAVSAYAPSDFPLAALDRRQLEVVLSSGGVEDIYPLSHMQHGMLFHSLLADGSPVYFQQFSCTLGGRLDLASFERAWQQLLSRHMILRTSFLWDGLDEPLQVVRKEVGLSVAVQDWLGLSTAEQQARLDLFLESDRRRPFDFSIAPLMRLNVIRMGEEINEFVWSYHHLLMDGWSSAMILKEVFLLYEAACNGAESPLARSTQYREYIAWLQRQDQATAEKFWRESLGGFNTPTTLAGGDGAREDSAPPADGYEEQQMRLSAETTSALRQLARRHELTLNSLVQGAWALLLSRYTGEEDVVFGAIVSGRPPELVGVEAIAGLFINALPVRVRVSPGASLLPWLKELQARQAEARQYEYSSLARIQGWSDMPPGRPLFESLLIFENYPVDASLRAERLNLSVIKYRAFEKTNYPVAVIVAPGERMLLQIRNTGQRLSATTTTRLLENLSALLQDMTEHPEKDLKSLSMLAAEENERLINAFNDDLSLA